MKQIALNTPVTAPAIPKHIRIRYGSPMISLGSCFSDTMAKKLYHLGYDILVNPFGTLYNPLSIARALEMLSIAETSLSEDELYCKGDKWVSLMHHSRFCSKQKEDLLQTINSLLRLGHQRLQTAHWLLITLGTSFAYKWRASQEIVANCHKLPAHLFDLHECSLEEMEKAMLGALQPILTHNKQLRILLTVSPIRYMNYGAHESALSKARLLLLTRTIERHFPERITYFPAYEIMMDELRDYRYYADDMLHPSPLAEEFIFHRLCQSMLLEEEEKIRSAALKLRQLAMHRSNDIRKHQALIVEWTEKYKNLFPSPKALTQTMEID